jgi:lambda family phage minor tail protein L
MIKILADIQKLEPGGKVHLFELDATDIGGDLLRFHGYGQVGPIWWQGNEYSPWAIDAVDFEITGDGQQPAPILSVGNIGVDENGNTVAGVISAMCIYLDDLAKAKITRRTTLAQYLDAANFEDGNADADPNEEFPPDVYFIEQKTSETSEVVTFELRNALDLNGEMLPGKQIVAGLCWWVRNGGYRGPYCGYAGSAMFDKQGEPTDNPALDDCGGQVSDCKKRYGEYDVINWGSYSAAGLVRT